MTSKEFYGTAPSTWRRTLARLAATGAITALAACQTTGTGARTGPSSGVVLGRVKGNVDQSALVVVAIDRASGRIAQRAFLARSNYYAMPMTAGRYKLYAFADRDRNGVRGASEPASLVYSMADDLRSGERIELPAFVLKP
jgi:hypothetical protein